MSDLRIHERRQGAWTVLELVGELDTVSTTRLCERLAQRAGGEAPLLIVALDQLTFLDSAGLAALVGARRATRTAGGKLRLVATDPRWLTLLQHTGLDKVLLPYPSADQAATDR